MSKIKALWTCLVGFKPKVVSTVEAIYQALVILIGVMTSAITTATTLKLDTSSLTKIMPIIEKVRSAVCKLAKYLGITFEEDTSADEEVEKLIAVDAKAFKRAVKGKKSSVTMSDVLASYTAAFDKIDELLSRD